MALHLDERQRAMLQEMHIRVWWPAEPAEVASQPDAARGPAARPGAATAPARPVRPAPVAPAPAAAAQPAPVGRDDTPAAPDAALPADAGLPALAQVVAHCSACALCEGRKRAVFAPPLPARQTDWMIVGDPPTADDERAGSPFAGIEGELLDNMLRAVQCSRSGSGAAGAWLTHVVKCRPEVLRNPQADELDRCAQHLRREVALVRPRMILAMGRFAAIALLSPTQPDVAQVPAGKLRGRLHHFEGVPVVVTYSPARLLRAPQEKAGAWADLCLARAALQSSDTPPAA
jgi:DNA polymerase